jgi:Ni,Fe-hydrogenase III small subunit
MFFINFIKEFLSKFTDKLYKPSVVPVDWKAPSILKRSLKLRVVDAGDDESTMAELYALEGPHYSLESYWIFFTASPKHADGIVVVGAVSQNMKNALLSAYSLTPNPKIVIACGDKAIHGDKRFPEVVGWARDVLWKVDVEIPGNPPSAKDILSSLVSFVRK